MSMDTATTTFTHHPDGADAGKKDPLGFLPFGGPFKTFVGWMSVVVAVWLLLNAVSMIGAGFQMAAGDRAEELFSFAQNPFVGLGIGILATAIMQSSSTTTSITVGMVAGGLPIEIAIPMLFGANLGTTVTATLVALGLSGNKEQFRRAFAMATVHDFFNLIALAIFMPLELATGFLQKTSGAIAHYTSGGSGGILNTIFSGIGDFVDAITEPLVSLAETAVSPLSHVWGGIILSIGGIALIMVVIGFIGNMLGTLLVGRAQEFLHAALGKGTLSGVLSGAVITTAVQSSSTTTSLTVPLAASGKFHMRDLFPFVVGANIGTTVTGLIAAFSAPPEVAEVAMQTALVHTLFNTFAAIIIMSLPFLRELPPKGAEWLAGLADKNKVYIFIWVGSVFFALPLLAIFITNWVS